MTTGQKIIKRELLTEEEADQVCGNLIQLSETGMWEIPAWAAELAQHYDIAEAHVAIQLAG
ncbi:MAG: hypothetical protein DRJ03_00500 [Chloroflexi bacterium]|nr:MAG: hypothetical protein DRJ03_00500 [Chloroflexota bacterium]